MIYSAPSSSCSGLLPSCSACPSPPASTYQGAFSCPTRDPLRHPLGLFGACLARFLRVDRLQHARRGLPPGHGHPPQYVAVEMHRAALVACPPRKTSSSAPSIPAHLSSVTSRTPELGRLLVEQRIGRLLDGLPHQILYVIAQRLFVDRCDVRGCGPCHLRR